MPSLGFRKSGNKREVLTPETYATLQHIPTPESEARVSIMLSVVTDF